MLKLIVDALFPPRCANCKQYVSSGALCSPCRDSIIIHSNFSCGLCRARLPENKKICHLAFPYILGGATDYSNPVVSSLIRALKFDLVRDCADPLAEIILEHLRLTGLKTIESVVVVPIPLGRRRNRERGFNQSELIARPVAEKLKIPLEHVLIRNKNTARQSELKDKAERMMNVRGCFSLAPDISVPKNVILIDDVVTTGATLFEASCVLKSAGVKRIYALVVAKA